MIFYKPLLDLEVRGSHDESDPRGEREGSEEKDWLGARESVPFSSCLTAEVQDSESGPVIA